MNVGCVYVVRTTLSKPPKDKLTICICAGENLFFWINTRPQSHGIGQIALAASDHSALTHECHLDCSRVTAFTPQELAVAKERDVVSPELARRIVAYLETTPPKTLAARHLNLAIANLSVLCGS